MPTRIADWCRARNLAPPETPGEFCRVILESLAHRYREVLEGLEKLTGRSIRTIHIVGGGSRNALLNRLVAQVTGRTVVAGPIEATAIGAGEVRNLEEARAIVRRSFEIRTFQ
jgi:rhamnulokinase